MKSLKKRMIASLMILAIGINLLYPIQIHADGVLKETHSQKTEESKRQYSGDGYEVTLEQTASWEGAFSVNVTLHNTGDETIQNWALKLTTANDILNVWNGKIEVHKDDQYIIRNAGYNQQIACGDSVTFGYTASLKESTPLPLDITTASWEKELDEEDYEVAFQVQNQWNTGYNGQLQIKNKLPDAIEGWTMEFDYDGEISRFWDADIVEHTENHYIVTNRGYNYKIDKGGMLELGFQATSTSENAQPSNYRMTQILIGEKETVRLDDGELEKDYYEIIRNHLLLDEYPVSNIKLSDDYDQDGLDLRQEYQYDTNPFLADSDEDGLDDSDELFVYQTDPNQWDTDSDTMSDGTEVAGGLNPLVTDSDGDGIPDNEETIIQEVRLDAVSELELSETGTLPSVTIKGKGDYSQQLDAEPIEAEENLSVIESLVGTPFDFVHEDALSFEQAEVTFQLSDEILKENDSKDLVIAWYDESENSLEPIKTEYHAATKSLTAQVEHFSIYMVINAVKYFYYTDYENEDSQIKTGKADIVFAIDTTGSMKTPIKNVKDNVKAFVEQLESENVDARFGLVEFKDIYKDGTGSTVNYGWHISTSAFLSSLSSLKVGGGGGDGPETPIDALECAYQMNYRAGVNRYIILLTDAVYAQGTNENHDISLGEEIKKLQEKELITSVITRKDLYSTYDTLVNETEGILGDISRNFATEAKALAQKVGKQAGGGVWIRLSNGTVTHLVKNPLLEDPSVDTDKDGVPDAEELGMRRQKKIYNPYSKKYQKESVWTFYSHPGKKDTDGDGLSDLEDARPQKYDIAIKEKTKSKITFNTGRVWYNIKCTSYDFLDNLFAATDNCVKNPIPSKEFKAIAECYRKNNKQKFKIDELTVIGVFNNEGAKLRMDNCSRKTRESVFKKIAGRGSKKFQHKGALKWEKWKPVSKKNKGGFFKGKVLTEADINFSNAVYRVCDVYTVINHIVAAGALVIAAVTVAGFTAVSAEVVTANIEAITFYCRLYGVKEGLGMFCCMGARHVPNSVYTGLIRGFQSSNKEEMSAVQYADDVVYTAENVWAEGPVVRGSKIDDILGNNLGRNFPVIDRISGNTVTSFKSVDLAAKSYQERSKLYSLLTRYVRQLKGFKGKAWNGTTIEEYEYDIKVLRVAIPKMKLTQQQKLAFEAAKIYAQERDIQVTVSVVTNR